MAVRLGGPVSDAPKSTTDWGTRVWNEWATSRATTIAGIQGIVP